MGVVCITCACALVGVIVSQFAVFDDDVGDGCVASGDGCVASGDGVRSDRFGLGRVAGACFRAGACAAGGLQLLLLAVALVVVG